MLVEPITRRFDRQGVRLGRPERPFRELAVQVLLADQQLALVVAASVGIHRAPVPDVFARPLAHGPVVEVEAHPDARARLRRAAVHGVPTPNPGRVAQQLVVLLQYKRLLVHAVQLRVGVVALRQQLLRAPPRQHLGEAPDLRLEPRDVARPLRLLLHVELIAPPRVALTPPAEGEAGSHAPVRRQRLPRRRLRLPPIFFGSTSLGAASQLSARDMRVTDTTRASTARRTAASVSSVTTLELLRSGKRRPLLQVRSRPVLPPPCAMPESTH